MDWFEQLNNYCERADATFWSEPVNAVSNLGFLLSAWLVWRLLRGSNDRYSRLLAVILGAIGIGSFLFHTVATRWSELADVLPITIFILAYLYCAARRFLNFPIWAGVAAILAFFPYSFALAGVLGSIVGPTNGSVAYVPVAVLIAIFAAIMQNRNRTTATGLAIGAAMLAVSLIFRTLDGNICSEIPLGTHFIWHVINAAMLGWMIRVMHRHQIA